MRLIAICAVVCACGGGRPPPLLFEPARSPAEPATRADDRVEIDLAALDAGRFRFHLEGRTITPQLVRRPLPNGTLVHGTFGRHGILSLARVGPTVTGIIRNGQVGFEIVPIVGGHRVVPRSWKPPLRSLHGPRWSEVEALRGEPLPLPPSPPSTEPVIVDVLFAYTKNVARDRTLAGVWGLVHVAIGDLNKATAADGSPVQFRVADLVPTEDTENDEDIYSIYYALLTKARFKDAHDARESARADILVLLVDKVDGGLGLATIMGTPETAVAVADHHDSLWYLTIPHEIGHIMGALHDDDTRNKPFTHGHAYSGTNGRTIMSNPCSVPTECPLIRRWSGPVNFGNTTRRHNARVIREMAKPVSRFRDKP